MRTLSSSTTDQGGCVWRTLALTLTDRSSTSLSSNVPGLTRHTPALGRYYQGWYVLYVKRVHAQGKAHDRQTLEEGGPDLILCMCDLEIHHLMYLQAY